MTVERSDFRIKLAQAMENVGDLMGVCPEDEGEIGIIGKYADDYLSVFYLGQLISSGDVDISISPSKIGYLKKLLHLEEL